VLQTLKSRADQAILFLMLILWATAWDFIDQYGSFQRTGRNKVFLIAAVWIAAIHVGKRWHWSVGLFYAYVGTLFFQQAMPVHSTAEFTFLTVALFLIPEAAKRITDRWFENAILLSGGVNAALGALNVFGFHPFISITNFQYIDRPHPVGLLGNETLLAPYLAFTVMVAAERFIRGAFAWRAVCAPLILLCVCVIFQCWSTMGFVSLGAGGLVIFAAHLGMAPAAAFAILACGAFVLAQVFNKNTNANLFDSSGRMDVWKEAFQIYLQKPLLGIGTGSWFLVAEALDAQKRELAQEACKCVVPKGRIWHQLHNEFLQGLFEFGLVGMSLLGVYLTKAAHCALKALQGKAVYAAGAAVFGANALGNFTIHVVPHGPLLAYCLFKLCEPKKKPVWILHS
jgi:O-antigen ligase